MKKRIAKIMALAILILIQASCIGHDRELKPFDDATDSVAIDTTVYLNRGKTAQLILHINYRLPMGDRYGKLRQLMINSDDQLSDYLKDDDTLSPNRAIQSFVTQYIKDYIHDAHQILSQEKDSAALLNWKLSIDTELKRGRNNNIVVLEHISIYEGGESSVTYTLARNFEEENYKLLTLKDLLNEDETNRLKEVLTRQLAGMQHCEDLEALRAKGFFVSSEVYLTENFYLTDGAITFIYTPGEIAPDSFGEQVVTLDL